MVLLAPALAAAPQDEMLAQSLFEEGRALLATGQVSLACGKLAESQRLDPAGGTLLNLALCHEREGKTGTAYVELQSALAQATKDGRDDRVEIARHHLRAIEPQLARIVIAVTGSSERAMVTLDGSPIPPAAWSSPTVVDPGPHVIEARAPGSETVRIDLHIAPGDRRTVPVALTDATGATQTSLAPADSASPPRLTKRASHPLSVPFIVAGGGLAGIGAAAGLFVWLPLYIGSTTIPSIDQTGPSPTAGAQTAAGVISLVGLGTGLPLLVTGLLLPERQVPVRAAFGSRSVTLTVDLPVRWLE